MSLNPHPTFPAGGHFVLKLHRDAGADPARLAGRLEHVVSGEAIDFIDGAALLAALARHAPAASSTPPASSTSTSTSTFTSTPNPASPRIAP